MRLSLFGLALCLGAAASAQTSIPIALPDTIFYAEPGAVAGVTAEIPIVVGADVSGAGIASADIDIAYDPDVLTITGSTLGPLVPSGCISGGVPGDGLYQFGVSCGSSNPFAGGPGVLLTLQVTFVAAGDSDLAFDDTTPFNEGDPAADITDGRFRIVTDPRPSIGAVDDQTVEEDGSVSFEVTIGDPDTPVENLTISAESAPLLVEASGVVVAPCDGQTAADACRTVTLSPIADANGTTTVTLTVSDGDDRSDDVTEAFDLTVTAVNDAPTVASPIDDVETPRSETVTVELTDVFADVEGDALTYSATSSDTDVVAVSLSGSTLTLTPGEQGEATVTVEAADGEPLTATDTFVVTALAGVDVEAGPAPFALHGARPNPTADVAAIAFDLPAQAEVRLEVYDVAGRTVYVTSEAVAAGPGQSLALPTDTFAPGVYAYRLVAALPGGPDAATGRLTVAR